MKLLDLVGHLRINMLHDTGGTGVDWASLRESEYDSIQLRWSNEELTRNINEAINQVYRRVQPIEDLIHIRLEKGKQVYPLHPSVQKIVKARTGDKRWLREVSLEEIWYRRDEDGLGADQYDSDLDQVRPQIPQSPQVLMNSTWVNVNTGSQIPGPLPVITVDQMILRDPFPNSYSNARGDQSRIVTCYAPNYITGTIMVYPRPSIDQVIDLMVYRLPLEPLCWDLNYKEPEIRKEYQIPMLAYAAYLCYMKDEANTLDPRKAQTYQANFDLEFPFTSVYSNIRKSRTANRPVKFGGYGGYVGPRSDRGNRGGYQ